MLGSGQNVPRRLEASCADANCPHGFLYCAMLIAKNRIDDAAVNRINR